MALLEDACGRELATLDAVRALALERDTYEKVERAVQLLAELVRLQPPRHGCTISRTRVSQTAADTVLVVLQLAVPAWSSSQSVAAATDWLLDQAGTASCSTTSTVSAAVCDTRVRLIVHPCRGGCRRTSSASNCTARSTFSYVSRSRASARTASRVASSLPHASSSSAIKHPWR